MKYPEDLNEGLILNPDGSGELAVKRAWSAYRKQPARVISRVILLLAVVLPLSLPMIARKFSDIAARIQFEDWLKVPVVVSHVEGSTYRVFSPEKCLGSVMPEFDFSQDQMQSKECMVNMGFENPISRLAHGELPLVGIVILFCIAVLTLFIASLVDSGQRDFESFLAAQGELNKDAFVPTSFLSDYYINWEHDLVNEESVWRAVELERKVKAFEQEEVHPLLDADVLTARRTKKRDEALIKLRAMQAEIALILDPR